MPRDGEPYLIFATAGKCRCSPRSSRFKSGSPIRTSFTKALASADLDGNGTPDLVAGYSYGGTGIITIHRGNRDAYAPADDSVSFGFQQGYNPASFVPEAEVYPSPFPLIDDREF